MSHNVWSPSVSSSISLLAHFQVSICWPNEGRGAVLKCNTNFKGQIGQTINAPYRSYGPGRKSIRHIRKLMTVLQVTYPTLLELELLCIFIYLSLSLPVLLYCYRIIVLMLYYYSLYHHDNDVTLSYIM